VVTETATPTAALARVSSDSMPAIPATSATAIVSLLTVVSPPNAVAALLKSKPEGSRSSWSCEKATAAAATQVPAIPRARVTKASPMSRGLRPTTPTLIAVIGRRSGLTAIAPTIRIPLRSMTP